MSNPDCTAGCGFICTCGDIDYSRENELAAETTRLRQQLAIAVHKLELLEAQHTGQAGSTKLSDCMAIMAKQAIAQIRELEK